MKSTIRHPRRKVYNLSKVVGCRKNVSDFYKNWLTSTVWTSYNIFFMISASFIRLKTICNTIDTFSFLSWQVMCCFAGQINMMLTKIFYLIFLEKQKLFYFTIFVVSKRAIEFQFPIAHCSCKRNFYKSVQASGNTQRGILAGLIKM